MKLRLLLITGILAFFGQYAQAQCAAYGYFTQNGASAIFYDSSYSVNGHDAYWSFGDGTGGNGTQVFHTYTSNGTYTACLTIYDSLANCFDSTCYTITVSSISNCNASLSYSVDSTNSSVYYFYGSAPPAGGSATITVWDFGSGSGTTYNSQSATHTFSGTGNHIAYYIVNDSSGNFCDSVEVRFTVAGSNGGPTCNAAFSYTVDGANPYKINFNNTSTNASTAYWWFGGNNGSTGYSPSHTFATAGYKGVCLTTYDSAGNFCDSICQTVYVPGQTSSSLCNAYFFTSVSGNTVSFYDSTTSNNIIEYSFGDGAYGYSGNPTHTYANAGTYTTCLFVYEVTLVGDTLLCDSFCQTVTIAPVSTCTASFTAHPDSLNTSAGSYPVYFSNNSTGSSYQWNFGDGSNSTLTNPTHTYSYQGFYNVCLYVYDSTTNGLVICDSSCQIIAVSGASCLAFFDYYADSTDYKKITFPNSSSGSNFIWSFGDGSTDTTKTPTHTYATSGTYNVCLYIVSQYDSLGLPIICDSICNTITVAPPIISCQASYYLGLDTNNLYNLYIINNSTGTSNTTNYFWSFGDGSTSTVQYPTHQYASFGLYELCLTISDSVTGCSSTHCDSIGLDSNGNLLKKGAFGITVVSEDDLSSTPKVDAIQGVSIYPNPTAGRFTLELNALQSEDLEIMVMSSIGQVISTSSERVNVGNNILKMDLSNNPNGIYFVTLRAGNQVKNIKLKIINE